MSSTATGEPTASGGNDARPVVLLLGTLDTKGAEYAYVADRLRALGAEPLIVDAGTDEPRGLTPDISRERLAEAAGTTSAQLAASGDRGTAVSAMARGAAAVVVELHAERRFDAILALGGSGGSSIAAAAMAALPVGVPKLLVSTMGSGDVRPYVGALDVMIMNSVVDIAGVNSVSARIMGNAAAAIAGMAGAPAPQIQDRPTVAASMFGVTTPAVTRARERLEQLGYEVLVFHATGTGGQSLEALAADGFLDGVLDLTTTELADDLVGGVLSAGPDRLTAAGRAGVPQVVSLGALDMVNFGPRETVPAQFEDRQLYVHNPTVTLMRTTPDECRELGRRIGAKLSAAQGATALFIPLRGVSLIDVEGQPFHDPEALTALRDGLAETLQDGVEVHEIDAAINDDAVADAMAQRLHELITERGDRT
ncbi:MAG TPA: Tm-1-like ATP-binding domain-containing protein [Solirubrobacteraceae bacterium]|nr:Tm-1-like ATP-binding domain-containing protein [Solirubrobacteraceae bacterium]